MTAAPRWVAAPRPPSPRTPKARAAVPEAHHLVLVLVFCPGRATLQAGRRQTKTNEQAQDQVVFHGRPAPPAAGSATRAPRAAAAPARPAELPPPARPPGPEPPRPAAGSASRAAAP